MSDNKRKSPPTHTPTDAKKPKQTSSTNQHPNFNKNKNKAKWAPKGPTSIDENDAGIWVTCNRRQEAKCVTEIRGLFYEHAEALGWKLPDVEKPEDLASGVGEVGLLSASPALEGEGEGEKGALSGREEGAKEERKEKAGRRGGDEDEEMDIESCIATELSTFVPHHLSTASTTKTKKVYDPLKPRLFENVKLETPCLTFIRLHPSLPRSAPIDLTLSIARAAAAATPRTWRTRHARKLTPMQIFRGASEDGLRGACRALFGGVFYADVASDPASSASGPAASGAASSAANTPQDARVQQPEDEQQAVPDRSSASPPPPLAQKSFAIRPNIRNSTRLTRESVIQIVASEVGRAHRVDLRKPDIVICVEVYQGKVGMGVVPGAEYEALRRFNLAEIVAPTPLPRGRDGVADGGGGAGVEKGKGEGEGEGDMVVDQGTSANAVDVQAGTGQVSTEAEAESAA